MDYNIPFNNYKTMANYVSGGRSPYSTGRKYTSAFRLVLRDGFIEIQNHKHIIARLHQDDVLEFVATPRVIWSCGPSLSQNMGKLLPVGFHNFATGKYKVIHASQFRDMPAFTGYTTAEYTARHNAYLEVRRQAQEYFQHLRLDLKTGQIINPKDMTPDTDETKRKQWLAGLKSFRLRLRAMVRVGALDGYLPVENRIYRSYMGAEEIHALAESIMSGEVSPYAVEILCQCTTPWRVREHRNKGEAVLATFENAIKTYSRDMRQHVGVITLKP